jgi:transposase
VEATGDEAVRSMEVEVVAKAVRRRFTAEYKLKVLRQADQCKRPGEIGGLLRREGLYWSNLAKWRKQRESGELAGLTGKKRGAGRRDRRGAKKISQLLGISLGESGEKE